MVYNTRKTDTKHKVLFNLFITHQDLHQEYESETELLLFLIRYFFLLQDNEINHNSCDLKTNHFLVSQGNGENGARYLDPKYSRWISTDPALGEYVPAAGKGNSSDAGNLPGMGGIYNSVNGNLYHYAGNNPITYTDPDGNDIDTAFSILYEKYSKTSVGSIRMAIGEFADRKYTMSPDEFRCDNFVQAVLTRAGFNYLDYLSGDATIRNVQNHIENALAKGITSKNKKENAPTLEYGIYIVLMNDSYVIDKNGDPLIPHCGFVFVKKDGSVEYTDNSSNNSNGGIETTSYGSLQKFQKAYGYNAFYYIKITRKNDQYFTTDGARENWLELMGL